MKKRFLFVLVVVAWTTSIFALDFSLGGSVDYTYSWRRTSNSTGSFFEGMAKSNFVGINGFFDVKYLRVSAGAAFLVGNESLDASLGSLGTSLNGKNSLTNVQLSVLLKYPFSLAFIDIFPMIGLDCDLNVAAHNDGSTINLTNEQRNDLHKFFLVGGVGLDINIGHFFITPTAMIGINLKKPSDYNTIKKLNSAYRDNTFMFNFGIGLGYKF